MPFLEVQGLTVRYPRAGAPALQDVSFAVERGERVLLLGPSGSGKSTIGLCLAGLIPSSVPAAQSGTVFLDGQDAADLSVGERTARIGMVFQDPDAQFCLLTVEDEVAFGLENVDLPPAEMDGRIRQALALVGLSERRRERLDHLSGGQKQRLALACALARRPELLFLDEPTANLDPAARHEFYQTLDRLHAADPALTLIVVEHVLDDVIASIDRVVLLEEGGRSGPAGTPAHIFSVLDDDLSRQGIWLPQVTALGRKLRRAGLPLEHLPLSVDEAAGLFSPLLSAHRLKRPAANATVCPLPANAAPALRVLDLHYHYPAGAAALRGASLEVPAGAFVALVGPNGAGKTTLASHVVDILRPAPERVWVFGQDVTTLSTAELTELVGFVFQNPEHQFVQSNVEDELAYSLRVRRRPVEEIQRAVEGLLSDFGLSEQGRRNPFALSQGQKRRLSVATMLAVGQRLLLLDEPTFGQDRHTAHALMERLLGLQRAGVTLFAITHDLQMVADYADCAVALVDGQVRFSGPTSALFAQEELLYAAALRPLPLHRLARSLDVCYTDGSLPLSIRDWLPAFGLPAGVPL